MKIDRFTKSLLLVVWLLITFILGQAYRGLVKSFLVISYPNFPVQNLRDIVAQTDYKVVFPSKTLIMDEIRVSIKIIYVFIKKYFSIYI